MTVLSRENLIQQLQWRYATKRFDASKKIGPQDWAALEQALILTPSSCGLQPWKFVVVADPVVRQKLLPASWGQQQVVGASHFVVFAVKKTVTEADVDEHVAHAAAVRGVPPETFKGLRDMILGAVVKGRNAAEQQEWATRQAYIALGNFMTSAAVLGIDACPMEGIEPPKYDAILDLGRQGLTAVVAAAAGYRAADDKYATARKVRFPKERVVMTV